METQKSGMSRFTKVLILMFIVAAIVFFSMIKSIAVMVSHLSDEASGEKRDHLTVLRIEGPIFDATSTLAILGRIEKDKHCRGILLRIDSPGGAVGASQEIFSALKRLRALGLPVVVSYGNIAASGGYYISLAGEKIFSNPGTLTGSIGVIMQFPEAEKLLDKIGVSLQTVKSGALKDVGSPARKPTPAELQYLQGVINDTYAQFLDDVVANRPISMDSLKPIADGRVLTGRQALKKGLVDTLGGFDDAKRYLITRTKMTDDIPWTQEPKPKSRMEKILDPESESESSTLLHWVAGVKQELTPGAFFIWPSFSN